MRKFANTGSIAVAMRLVLLLLIIFAVAKCDRSDEAARPQSSHRTDASDDTNSHVFRIVCLSPAITDTLIDLGLKAHIVGRDGYENQLDDSVKRVGNLSQLDLERILTLNPTDVVLQAGSGGIPRAVQDIAVAQGWNLINLHIDGADDIEATLSALPERLTFGGDDLLREEARIRAGTLRTEIKEAMRPLDVSIRQQLGSVLIMFESDPPWAYAEGSYLADVADAMGVPCPLDPGSKYRQLAVEDLVRIDPWAIIFVASSGQPRTRAGVEAGEALALLGALRELPLRAITSGRVVRLTHPQALLPSSSLIEVSEEMRTIFTQLAEPAESVEP